MKCTTPAVKIHGRVSVEVSLDAQHWSMRAEAQIVNSLVQSSVSLSPGLAEDPSELMPVDAAHILLGYKGVYLQYYGVRIPYTCGSNVWNNLGHSITDSHNNPVRRAARDSAAAPSPPFFVQEQEHALSTTTRMVVEPDFCVQCSPTAVEVADLAGMLPARDPARQPRAAV